jgi:hypothetical protein
VFNGIINYTALLLTIFFVGSRADGLAQHKLLCELQRLRNHRCLPTCDLDLRHQAIGSICKKDLPTPPITNRPDDGFGQRATERDMCSRRLERAAQQCHRHRVVTPANFKAVPLPEISAWMPYSAKKATHRDRLSTSIFGSSKLRVALHENTLMLHEFSGKSRFCT